MDIKQLIQNPATTIVDVRTPAEFGGGHVPGSVNIPLQEIPERIDELRRMKAPLVFCCASGNRSGQAVHYLKQLGFVDVHNGGGWMDVDHLREQHLQP